MFFNITPLIWLMLREARLNNIKEQLDKQKEEDARERFPYISFDGKLKYCYLGKSYFDALEYEKHFIMTLPIYSQIVNECRKTTEKDVVLKDLSGWVLPTEIFKLMPLWWQNNGNTIQGMSPSVSAINSIIRSELNKL